MKLITRDNLPCWFELHFRRGEDSSHISPSLLLRVHKEFIRQVSCFAPNNPVIKSYMKQFKFSDFYGKFDTSFGFDGAFEFLREAKDGFAEFSIAIPIVAKETDRPCEYCNNSGNAGKCVACRGIGKQHNYDATPIFAISASLSVFSRMSEFFEKETLARNPQLFTLCVITDHGQNGGAFGGRVSEVMRKKLKLKFPEGVTRVPSAIDAMKEVYDKMLGDQSRDYSFRAEIDDRGSISLSCPGNCCCVSGGHNSGHGDEGYEFHSHNVDSPIQQITLLVGLVAVCDLIK